MWEGYELCPFIYHNNTDNPPNNPQVANPYLEMVTGGRRYSLAPWYFTLDLGNTAPSFIITPMEKCPKWRARGGVTPLSQGIVGEEKN